MIDERAAPPPGRYPELHAAWLRRLRWEHERINATDLRGALHPAVLAIAGFDEITSLGRWSGEARTIWIAERHVLQHAWDDVLETLRHEMAHQYAEEVLGVTDEPPHGPAFAEACRRLGIEPAASGRPARERSSDVDRIFQKVRKLLALAESHNVHEAESAMAMANRLLLQHNLELSAAAGHRDYGWRRLGPAFASLPLPHKIVAGILTEFFFVEAIWVTVYDALADRDARRLEVLGSDTNLEMAEYVHAFLHDEAERLWRQARPRLAAHGRRARHDFVVGVLMGFRAKLREERSASAERGLVWVGDAGLEDYYDLRHPQRGTMRGGRYRQTPAHAEGQAAGRAMRLRRGVTGGGGEPGRLLGG